MRLLTEIARIFNWLALPFVIGLLYVLYFTLAEFICSYTMDKKMVNLRVVDANEKTLSKSAFTRNISKIYVLLSLLETLGGFFKSKDARKDMLIKS